MKRRMSKVAVAAIILAGAIALPAAYAWGCAGSEEASAQGAASGSPTPSSDDKPADPTEPITYPSGSTVTLDSSSADAVYDIGDGQERRVAFPWDGKMELTVLGSELYRGDSAKSKAGETGAYLVSGDDRLLLVTCRLKNIDAVPVAEDFTGRLAFSASIFHVPGTEARYFSAATAPEGNHEYLSFQLAQGEEMEFTLGYPWRSDKPGAPEDVPSYMTPGVDGTCGHIRVNLATTLMD